MPEGSDELAEVIVLDSDGVLDILVSDDVLSWEHATTVDGPDWPSQTDTEFEPEPSSELSQLSLSESQQKAFDAPEPAFERGIEQLRARCQVLPSDATTVRAGHGDGPALSNRIIGKIPTTEAGWCRLANLAPNKEGGYPQVSWDGVNKFATLGEVVLWSKGESKPAARPGEQQPDTSHLCDQPRCTVAEHVCLEDKAANNARKGCVPWTQCAETCSRCRGKQVILNCPHEPPCVEFHSDFRSQADLLANGICRDDSEVNKERVAKKRADSTRGLSRRHG